MKRILICGESYMGYTVHIKGADSMTTSGYFENVGWLKQALENGGYDITYMPSHLALADFPDTAQKLGAWDLLILSDVGANTLLMTTPSFRQGVPMPDRCQAIRAYVHAGGSLMMIGGFMSFTGIEGKARYGTTPIADVLPVALLPYDDRVETSAGSVPVILEPAHPVFSGIDGAWPCFIGYNKTVADDKRGQVLATIGGDPFIAVGSFGEGRSAAFTSDCAPHWGSPQFLSWQHYGRLWCNLAAWLTRQADTK